MNAAAPHVPTAPRSKRRTPFDRASIARVLHRRDEQPTIDRIAMPSEIAIRSINEITPRA